MLLFLIVDNPFLYVVGIALSCDVFVGIGVGFGRACAHYMHVSVCAIQVCKMIGCIEIVMCCFLLAVLH